MILAFLVFRSLSKQALVQLLLVVYALSIVQAFPNPLVVALPNSLLLILVISLTLYSWGRLIMLFRPPRCFLISPTNLYPLKHCVTDLKRVVGRLWLRRKGLFLNLIKKRLGRNLQRGTENGLLRIGRGSGGLMRLKSIV